MRFPIPSFDWRLWLRWTLAVTIAWNLADGVLGLVLSFALEFPGARAAAVTYYLLSAGVLGVVVGLAQIFALREHRPNVLKWTLASGIGLFVGRTMAIRLFSLGEPSQVRSASPILGSALVGFILGSLQSFYLPGGRDPQRTRWWTVASTLGMAAGSVIGWIDLAYAALTGLTIPLLMLGVDSSEPSAEAAG